MNHDPKRPTDRPDAFLKACDPVEKSTLSADAIESALDEIGVEITSRSREVTSRRTRRLSITKPRTALLIGFATIGIGAAVAGGSQLSARTGHFQPTPQEIAKASPEKAKILQSYLDMGGPGEELNPAAPDFGEVARQISADIPFPNGYESWRDSLIAEEVDRGQSNQASAEKMGAQIRETSGYLHGQFVMSSFCAWVLDWRYADKTGNSEAAAKAAQVISEAPSWKAVTDWDPHPDPTVLGDMGFIRPTLFGWMLPYRDAVQAGDRTRVEHLLVTGYYGGRFQWYDPDWRALETAHPEWARTLSESQRQQKYEQYLASRSS